jgi:transcription elongation factor Elf1
MSIQRTVEIQCPSCGAQQQVQLYEVINVQQEPALKEALMHNQLNRVVCESCDLDFRVDLPLLYTDATQEMMIHWVPESAQVSREQILEEFDEAIERMNAEASEELALPSVRLVMSRVELVELIYMLEEGINQRVIEYIKYSMYTRNSEKLNPHTQRLLLNVEDSTDEELCFVVQEVETQQLGEILRYGKAAYHSLLELHEEDPDEFMELFPGPCISARDVLLEE